MIRRATIADARELADLGRRLFMAAFGAANDPDDMRTYLDAAFNVATQHRELADASMTTWIQEDDAGRWIGYAQLRESSAPADMVIGRALEIARFYVDPEWHGRGAAPALMAHCIDDARRRDAAALWLGVWENNLRAIRFYERSGFHRAGAQDFWLGRDRQRDAIMVLDLRVDRNPRS